MQTSSGGSRTSLVILCGCRSSSARFPLSGGTAPADVLIISCETQTEQPQFFSGGLRKASQKDRLMNQTCFERGYRKGYEFARFEADYDELAAVYRAGGIPASWDLYRAEILNRHLGDKAFDFQSYAAGFARACTEFFEKI